MKNNIYLYGVDNPPPIPEGFREKRITILRRHLNKLLQEPNATGTTRVGDVVKAISFWEKLS